MLSKHLKGNVSWRVTLGIGGIEPSPKESRLRDDTRGGCVCVCETTAGLMYPLIPAHMGLCCGNRM